MTDIKQVTDIIDTCKKDLRRFHKQAQEISKNKDVVDWQKVNIDSFRNIIDDLGLPDDLRHARDSYPEIASAVLKQTSHIQNSIGNLEADIKLGPLEVSDALSMAQKIAAEISALVPSIQKLQHCQTGLESSSITLRQHLNLKTLLPLVRTSVEGTKKSMFETGFAIYLKTTRETGFEDEGQENMYTYIDQASHLQKKLAELNSDDISKMANSLINLHIRLCYDGLQEVKDFVLFVENYLHKDIENIHTFHAELAKEANKPLTEILFSIPHQTEKVSGYIRDFCHKKFLMEELERASQLILMVEQFHMILTEHFLHYFRDQSTLENSLLNPDTLAKAQARKYFSGFIGLWRMFRMLLGSIKQQDLISEDVLQEKLRHILENCSHFFGHTENDLEKISTFIESSFHQYATPFPHDDLVNIAKKCLITYGAILEKIIFRYKPEQQNKNTYTMGQILGKIEVRVANLQKYRAKLSTSKSSQ